jgi:hypothetical protein
MTIAVLLLFCVSGHIGNQQAIAQGGFGDGFGPGFGGDYGGYGGGPYVNCRIFIYSTGPCL